MIVLLRKLRAEIRNLSHNVKMAERGARKLKGPYVQAQRRDETALRLNSEPERLSN